MKIRGNQMKATHAQRKLYYCKLVNPNGRVQESFWKAAETEESLLDALESHDWPTGTWEIEEE
jgi:hypothetical protein